MKTQLLLILAIVVTLNTLAQSPLGFEDHLISGPTADGAYSDIDGDGDKDMFLSLVGDSLMTFRLVWLENTDGKGHYGEPQIINDNTNHFSVVSADINGDGKMDVVVGPFTSASPVNSPPGLSSGNISWYQNLGQGNFGTEQNIDVDESKAIFAKDMDGDGNVDIINISILNNNFVINWYENLNGQGSFGTKQTIITSSNSIYNMSIVDLDGDTDLDLLAELDSSKKLVWYENLGQGNFSGSIKETIDNQTNNYIHSVFPADMDGDGDLDVIANLDPIVNIIPSPNIPEEIIWYENTGGTFGNPQTLITTYNVVFGVWSYDLDADGDMDILSSDKTATNFYNNTGQLSFGALQMLTESTATIVDFADLEGDGDKDLLWYSSRFFWNENLNSQGSFSVDQHIFIPVPPSFLEIGDIDGDGDLDILTESKAIVISFDADLIWFENRNGLFAPKSIESVTLGMSEFVKILDMDGDSDMDLFVGMRGEAIWHENLNGQGDFGPAQIINYNSTANNSKTTGADIDGDGDMDLLRWTAVPNNNLIWLENNGQGNFGSAQTISTNALPGYTALYATDMDGDSDLDVLCTDNQNVVWYENTNGQGNFGAQQTVANINEFIYAIYHTDIDGDGDRDVLSTTETKVSWHENTNGLGTFGTSHDITTNAQRAVSIRASDLDGDGDNDVITGSQLDKKLAWYENANGQGSFGPSQTIDNLFFGNFSSLQIEDMDFDGAMDILVSTSGGFLWHENLGALGNQINGAVRMDMNANGCTPADLPIPNIMVTSDNGTNTFSTFTLANGSYILPTNPGNFTTTTGSSFPNYFTINPASHSSSFSGLGNTDTADFCALSTGTINDLNIAIYPLTDARPGFDTKYQLVFRNMGTTVLNGSVDFVYDGSKIAFVSASATPASQSTNNLSFNYSGLNPFETRTIDLTFNVAAPPTVNNSDVLSYTATINPVSGDNTQNDNTFVFDQTVVGSFDPNDIQVVEGNEIYLSEADEYLHYIIRFQNTGTASAINIRVANVLGPKLDWATLQLENMSHSGRVEIENGNQVEFIFDNIFLPDSNSDEPGSHGFIQYKIKPKSNVAVNDMISNTADIFFDFNPPITTNTVTTTVVQNMSITEKNLQNLYIYPNPANDKLNIAGDFRVIEAKVYNGLGQELFFLQNGEGIKSVDLNGLSQGLYFIKLKGGNGKSTVKKFLKMD